MNIRGFFAGISLAVVVAAPSAPAFADIPPPDSCQAAGASCANAGTTYDKPGHCQQETCTKGAPSAQMQYACLRCREDGADGGGGAQAGAGGSTGTAGSTGTGGGSSSGCSVAGAGNGGALALVAAALILTRRRRRA